MGALSRSGRGAGKIIYAISTRRDFKFRRTAANDFGAARRLEVFPTRFSFKRARCGQTGPRNLSTRTEHKSPRPERSSARRRRSGARLESGHRRGTVDLSIGSKEKFSPRFVIDLINGSVGLI